MARATKTVRVVVMSSDVQNDRLTVLGRLIGIGTDGGEGYDYIRFHSTRA